MKYHANAQTCYNVRLKIHTSTRTIKQTAELLSIHPSTVKRWKKRTDFEDRSHRPKNIKYAMNEIEREAFLAARSATFDGLDEIIDQMELKFKKKFSRSTVYRLFKSNGLNKKTLLREKPKKFKSYSPGFIHIDVTEVPVIGGGNNNFLYVAIDRATRYMYYKRYDRQNQASSLDFMEACIKAFPFGIHKILTDNGKEFSNAWIRPTGKAKNKTVIDSLLTRFCKANGIEHRLTKPYHPQTNGMVERVNRKIKEATIFQFQYQNDEELNLHLGAFLEAYNTQKRHSGLVKEIGVRTPIDAIKKFAA